MLDVNSVYLCGVSWPCKIGKKSPFTSLSYPTMMSVGSTYKGVDIIMGWYLTQK